MRKQGRKLGVCSVIVAFLSLVTSTLYAQRCFESIQEAKLSAECVECIDLSKKKLTTLPKELLDFKDLKRLILSRNRLSEGLEDLSKLKNLRYLDLSSNYIESLPKDLRGLDLDSLVIWDNPIYTFPKEFSEIPLRYLDMRAIQMTRKEQEFIKSLFPQARIRMGHPCNCSARRE